MPRVTRWSQLTIGLVALAGVIAVAGGVLVFARVGALRGPATMLYMVTDRASRVIKGTDVWLGGQKVGVVDAVTLRGVSTDTADRVLIRMRVLDQFMPYVRRNSSAQIRSGSTLIGAPVVAITVGTRATPQLHAGDTLRALTQYETQPVSADLGVLGDSVIAIVGGTRRIMAQMDTTGSAIRLLRTRSVGEVGAVARAFEAFQDRAVRSGGTVALALADTALRGKVAHVRAVADSLRAAARSAHGVGRFARDTTLLVHARHALATTDSLRARIARYRADPAGGDTALAAQLARTRLELDSLVSDVKHHPLRYLHF